MPQAPPSIITELERCANCPLLGCSRYVPGEGSVRKNGIFVVGEAPGKEEDKAGRPFVGRSGELVRGILDALGATDKVWITNLVKRRPADSSGNNRKPNDVEIYKCGCHLVVEIEEMKPKYIIALGATSAEFLLEKRLPMSIMHGLTAKRQTQFGWEYVVMPTYHPSYILRTGGIHSRIGDQWLGDLTDFFEKAADVL